MPLPVHSDQICFGRAELLDRLLRRAVGLTAGYRQNLALIGPPGIGKSTILQRAVELLKQHPPLLPVALHLREGSTLAEFAEQFGSTLLYRYWTDLRPAGAGRDAPQTFEALARVCQPYLPKTTALLAQGLARARRGHVSALTALFEAPGQLRKESGRLCVIFLDEFHRLSAWGGSKSYAALSRQVVVQQETMYVLASSAVEEARRVLRDRLAVLFGHFEIIPVEPFDPATSVRFLTELGGLTRLGLPTVIALADLAEGDPGTLAQIARALPARGQATDDDVPLALTALLFQPTGALARQCQEALARLPLRRRAAVLPVLSAVAQGHHRMIAIAAATGRTVTDVTRAVRTLAEHGLVTRRGVFCAVSRRLLRLWLQAAYPIQQGPVHLEAAVAEQVFAESVRAWLSQVTSRAPQQVLETVAEVMRRFQNELVELHGRRVRLPKFDVHTLLVPGAPRAVVGQRLRPEEAAPRPSGQRDDTRWLCVPYTAAVREGDAVALIQALRHAAKPWTRRLVIALEGLEVNARLLLQEHRFWVLELEDLNQLLELYGMPRLLPTALQALATVSAVPAAPAEPVEDHPQQASAS